MIKIERLMNILKPLLRSRSFSDLVLLLIQLLSETFSEVISHYGCPNSNRTRKLHLQKTMHR